MSVTPRFVRLHEQAPVPVYWGGMYKVTELGGFAQFRVEFADGVAHRTHRHPRHDETVYVVSGAIEQAIAGEEAVLRAGECAVIPRGVPHSAMPLTPGTVVLVTLKGEGSEYEAEEMGGA